MRRSSSACDRGSGIAFSSSMRFFPTCSPVTKIASPSARRASSRLSSFSFLLTAAKVSPGGAAGAGSPARAGSADASRSPAASVGPVGRRKLLVVLLRILDVVLLLGLMALLLATPLLGRLLRGVRHRAQEGVRVAVVD